MSSTKGALPMTAADILQQTKKSLLKHGWQNRAAPFDSAAPHYDGPRCVLQAVWSVVDEGSAAYDEAYGLLTLAVGLDAGTYFSIGEWNDAPGRSEADVHYVLDAAIEMAGY